MKARKVAEHIINSHGQKAFVQLIEMFKNQVPGSLIAKEFSVSRQRVHQWKHAIGEEHKSFELKSEVFDLISSNFHRTTI